MSSGEVGSSIQYGSNSASRAIHAIASSTPQRWFASTATIASGPTSSRTIRNRRRSSSRSAPTLSLNAVQPSARASRQSRRILASPEPGLALRTPGGQRVEPLEGPLRREGIGDVPEVDERHDLLGRHVDDQLPEGLACRLREQVPGRVHDRGRREVDDALLRSDPAELAVADELPPERAHVGEERFGPAPENQWAQGVDR